MNWNRGDKLNSYLATFTTHNRTSSQNSFKGTIIHAHKKVNFDSHVDYDRILFLVSYQMLVESHSSNISDTDVAFYDIL